MDRNRLTRQQLTCLQVAARGSLHRWPGGQWTDRPEGTGVAPVSFASITIHILVSRGLMVFVGPPIVLPEEVRITDAGRERLARHHGGHS